MSALDTCNSDQDCRLVHPGCEHWNDVTCFYPANYCTDGTLVSDFNSAAGSCGDPSDVCDCGAPPAVQCTDHHCVFVDTTTTN
ncbi:MAG: hypothetical protein R3F59_08780 [Myxococcota bacterium]